MGADLVPISHVSSCHQLASIFYDLITVTVVCHCVIAAVQHALLERDQLIDVMAVAGRGGRAMYVLARPSRGKHAKAAVQAREKPPHGWPWMAAREASLRACTASHLDVSHGPVRSPRE